MSLYKDREDSDREDSIGRLADRAGLSKSVLNVREENASKETDRIGHGGYITSSIAQVVEPELNQPWAMLLAPGPHHLTALSNPEAS
jgi:hypothetical protein